MEWWEPLGESGEVVPDGFMEAARHKDILETGKGGARDVATVECGGRSARVRFSQGLCEAYDGATTVASLRFAHPKPLEVQGTLLGEELLLRLDRDTSRGSRVRGPLRFWQISVGERTRVWHYEDRSNASEFIMSDGSGPGGETLVGTAHDWIRAEGVDAEARRATVLRWSARARPVDVVLARLVDLTPLRDAVWSRAISGVYAAGAAAAWFLDGWVPDSSPRS